jgi:hypothetical protein
MGIANKTTELALLIDNQFEQSRLQSEKIDPELGRHKFIIETTDANVISIQVPEVIQVPRYTEQIFNIVESIIDEASFQVTEPIEIKIYGPDRIQLDDLTLYPMSEPIATVKENEIDCEEPFEVAVNGQAYLITPLEDETFDVNMGPNRIGNIQHYIEHYNGPRWVTNDMIADEDVEAIGNAIEFRYC